MWLVDFFFVKQKTAYEMRMSDWSSDVCSSDLPANTEAAALLEIFRQLAERGQIFAVSGSAVLFWAWLLGRPVPSPVQEQRVTRKAGGPTCLNEAGRS